MAFVKRIPAYALIAASLAIPFEGMRLVAYPDHLAHNIPTVCFGMTSADRPVKLGDHYTAEQCKQFLAEDLVKYHDAIAPCIHVPLSQHEQGALTDLAYNVGPGAVCKSTALKRFNAGDHAGGCDAIKAYNRSMGRVVNGLIRRRKAEITVCDQKD